MLKRTLKKNWRGIQRLYQIVRRVCNTSKKMQNFALVECHMLCLSFSPLDFLDMYTQSHFAGLACFELFIFPPQAPKCWDCRCAPPHLACILVCSTSSITPGADLLTRLMTVFFLLWSLSLMLVSVGLAGAGHGYACWSSAIFSHGKQCYSATVSPESMCRAFWRVTWCELQLLSRD